MDREQILSQFEGWLDRVLADEEPPQGIAAEIISTLQTEEDGGREERQWDLYSMWEAMTALTQEVKLQGRSFKQLTDAVTPVAELAPELLEMQRKADERARLEILDLLLDLRDRMGRGLESVHAAQAQLEEAVRAGWVERRFGLDKARKSFASAATALEKGYALCIGRLDEALAEFDIQPIDCSGQLFDPELMHAVDMQETREGEDGAVIEVYRPGYTLNGEVYRVAQVKVARRPATSWQETPDE